MKYLCAYKDLFGKPDTGIHSIRFMNLAVMDIIMTLIGAYLISYATKISFSIVAIVLFILGIIAHRLFCVRSTIDKLLFPN
jgi:hypothetical protein